jgi:hypothetical protein
MKLGKKRRKGGGERRKKKQKGVRWGPHNALTTCFY